MKAIGAGRAVLRAPALLDRGIARQGVRCPDATWAPSLKGRAPAPAGKSDQPQAALASRRQRFQAEGALGKWVPHGEKLYFQGAKEA
ncbi:hypothetical protein M8494_20260 [Serratia ureilytica]